MRNYFLAAAGGNFNAALFLESVRKLSWPVILVHALLVSAALHFPLALSLARLTPWELFSRLDSGLLSRFAEDQKMTAEEFNAALLDSGYGQRVLLPAAALTFGIVLILQAVFYASAAFFLGLSRLTRTYLPWKERTGIFVFASTLPAAAAALLGLALPVLHIIVFYLAVILAGFAVANRAERARDT